MTRNLQLTIKAVKSASALLPGLHHTARPKSPLTIRATIIEPGTAIILLNFSQPIDSAVKRIVIGKTTGKTADQMITARHQCKGAETLRQPPLIQLLICRLIAVQNSAFNIGPPNSSTSGIPDYTFAQLILNLDGINQSSSHHGLITPSLIYSINNVLSRLVHLLSTAARLVNLRTNTKTIDSSLQPFICSICTHTTHSQ